MSIYGGFGLRKTESKYNWCLEQILGILSNKLISLIEKDSEQNGVSFKFKFGKIYCLMKIMEDHKYLPPKFSDCVRKLADHVGIDNAFFEQQAQTIKGDSIIMEHSNEKQTTRLDSQQTPPKMLKVKMNSLNTSQVKALRTPNSSQKRQRQLSTGNYFMHNQNIIINPQQKFNNRDMSTIFNNNPNESVIDNNSRIYTYQQFQSLDHSKNIYNNTQEKPYEGKHKELINRVQQNIQVVHSVQNSEHKKLANSSNNPYTRHYSPTPDVSTRASKNQALIDNPSYSNNYNNNLASRKSISNNNPLFYASNAFANEKNKDKNAPNKNTLYNPNSFDDRIRVLKKPKTQQGQRNQSVNPNFTSNNNNNNSTIEQASMFGSDKKQVKNIRLKKQKLKKIQNTKEDQNTILHTQQVNEEDSTGQTIFNSNVKNSRLPSFSPNRSRVEGDEDLEGFLESNVIYKEKESFNLASYDQKYQEHQKVRVKDVLLIEDQIINQDKTDLQS